MGFSIRPLLFWIGAIAIAAAPVQASKLPKPPPPTTPKIAVIADNLCPVGDDPDAIDVCALKMRPQDILQLHGYAGCLADKHGDEARIAVRAYVNRASSDALRTLIAAGADCRPSHATRISGVLLQGSIAEHLVAEHRDATVAIDPGKTANLIDCLVAIDPRSAAGLLSSRPLSTREAAMITRLAADLPSCVPANTKLETNALALRAMVALAMFNVIEPRPAGEPLPTAQPLIASLPIISDAKVQRIVAVLPAIRVEEARAELPRMFENHSHPGLMPYLNQEDIEAAGAAFCADVSCLDHGTVKVPVTRDTSSNPYSTSGPAGITNP